MLSNVCGGWAQNEDVSRRILPRAQRNQRKLQSPATRAAVQHHDMVISSSNNNNEKTNQSTRTLPPTNVQTQAERQGDREKQRDREKKGAERERGRGRCKSASDVLTTLSIPGHFEVAHCVGPSRMSDLAQEP